MAYLRSRYTNMGMARDIDPAKASNRYAWENVNIRLTARDHDTLLSVTNERGNLVAPVYERYHSVREDGSWEWGRTVGEETVYFSSETMALAGTVLGYNVLNNYVTVFTVDKDDTDHIYRIEYVKGDEHEWQCVELYSGDLGFSVENPIETIGDYESEDVQKVYWLDGVNQPRFVNISDRYLTEYGIGEGTKFDFVASFEPTLQVAVEKTYEGAGLFSGGTVQYVFTYSNKYGQQSNIVYVTAVYYASPSGRGADPEETVNCQFTITLSAFDTTWQYVNIYRIMQTSESGQWVADKIAQVSTTTEGEYVYTDDGSSAESADPASLLYVGGREISAYTFCAKDQTLFLGNIRLLTVDSDPVIKGFFDTARDNDTGYSPLLKFDYADEEHSIPYVAAAGYYPYSCQLDCSSEQIRTFKAGEKYRIGIRFITNTGSRSAVYWVGDVEQTFYPVTDLTELLVKKACLHCSLPEGLYTYLTEQGYAQAELMMAERTVSDRCVQAQGIIVPTVFNLRDRYNDAPFAISSWYARPRLSERMTDRHYEGIPQNNCFGAEIQCIKESVDCWGDTSNIEDNWVYMSWALSVERGARYYHLKQHLYLYYGNANHAYAIQKIVNGKKYFDSNKRIANQVVSQLNEWGFNGEKYRDEIKDLCEGAEGYFKHKDKGDIKWLYEASSDSLQSRSKPVGAISTDMGGTYAAKHHNSFYVDENICTFHTPELYEGVESTFERANYQLRVIGMAPVTAQWCDYSAQISNFATTGDQVVKYNLNEANIADSVDGLITFPFFMGDDVRTCKVEGDEIAKDGDDDEYEDITTMMYIYPWHKTGSITNSNSGSGEVIVEGSGELGVDTGEAQNVLESKTESNFRFCYQTDYLWARGEKGEFDGSYYRAWRPPYGIYGLRVFNSSEATLMQIETPWGQKTYQGNYDILLSCQQSQSISDDDDKEYDISTDDGYRVYDTYALSGYNDKNVVYQSCEVESDDDVGEYKSYLYKKDTDHLFYDPVNITAKSTEHIVVSFASQSGSEGDDKEIVMLPNIRQSDYVSEGDDDTGWKVDWVDSPVSDNGGELYLPWNSVTTDITGLENYTLVVPSRSGDVQNVYFTGTLESSGDELYLTITDDYAYLVETLSDLDFSSDNGYVFLHLSQQLNYSAVLASGYTVIPTAVPAPWNFMVVGGEPVLVQTDTGHSLEISVTYVLNPLCSGVDFGALGAPDQISMDTDGVWHATFVIDNVYDGYTLELCMTALATDTEWFTDSLQTLYYSCSVTVTTVVDPDTGEETEEWNLTDMMLHTHGTEDLSENATVMVTGTALESGVLIADVEEPEYDDTGQPTGEMRQVRLQYKYLDGKLEQVRVNSFSFYTDNPLEVTSTEVPSHSFLLIAELYTDYGDNDSRYGGITEYAVQGNTFIPLGNVTALTGEGQTLLAYAGDTYFQRWDCQKTCKYSDSSENNVNEFVSVMLETYRNIEGRYDIRRGLLDNQATSPENSNLFNDAYDNLGTLFNSYVLDGKYSLDSYPCQITWTLEKTLTEEIDTWTNITLASTLDMDGDKGDVRALRRLSNSIVSFQDRGIAEVLFNTRTQLSTEQGVPVEIANSGRVEGKRYMTEKNGCLNKWSIAQTRSSVWFVDNIAKSICRIGQSVEDVSSAKGFGEWIRNNNSVDIWNPQDFGNFTAYCDTVHNDVYFIRDGGSAHDTLSFSETLNEFSSFFDYGPVTGMTNVADRYVAFRKLDSDDDDTLMWLQGEGLYDHLFGSYRDFSVTYRVAPDPYGDKTFTNLEYRADMFDMDEPNPYMAGEGRITGDTFDSLTVWDEYQGNETSLGYDTFKDTYADKRRKYRIWRTDIPRARKGPDNPFGLNRIRNPWIWLKLHKDTSSYAEGHNTMMSFHDLAVDYIE